jgi:anti-sigma factor RsiW
MKHEEYRQLIAVMRDEVLSAEEHQVAQKHLQGCQSCRAYLADLKRIHEAVRSIEPVPLRASFAADVTRLVHRQDNQATSWTNIEHYARAAFAVLAFAVMVLVVFTSFNGSSVPPPVDRYVSAEPVDSLSGHILFKQGELSRSDVFLAVVSR